jgi:hypothetical protein
LRIAAWSPSGRAIFRPAGGTSAKSSATVGGSLMLASGNLSYHFCGTFHGMCGLWNPHARKNGLSCRLPSCSIDQLAIR